MIYQYDQAVSQQDRTTLERTFQGFPDHYSCRVYHSGGPLWNLWVFRGGASYLLSYHQRELAGHEAELRHEMERALRAIEAQRTASGDTTENPVEVTREEQMAIRMADFERSMPRWLVQEKAEKGQLPGLEELGPKKDPWADFHFDLKPRLVVHKGEIS